MSSSRKEDSLLGLRQLLLEVAQKLKDREKCDLRVYDRLQEAINSLQICCPNHPGVLHARVQWYRWGLDSFRDYVLANLANRTFDWVAGLEFNRTHSRGLVLAGVDTLEHFLKRAYLKDSFSLCYGLLITAYQAVEKVPDVTIQERYHQKVVNLETKLLEGRF